MNISFLDIFTLRLFRGASEDIIEKVGFVADRMSVNLELPTKEGLQQLAPNKNYTNIFETDEADSDGFRQIDFRW